MVRGMQVTIWRVIESSFAVPSDPISAVDHLEAIFVVFCDRVQRFGSFGVLIQAPRNETNEILPE